jgi:hypothetical protein
MTLNRGELQYIRHNPGTKRSRHAEQIGLASSAAQVWLTRTDFFVDPSPCVIIDVALVGGSNVIFVLTQRGPGWIYESKVGDL